MQLSMKAIQVLAETLIFRNLKEKPVNSFFRIKNRSTTLIRAQAIRITLTILMLTRPRLISMWSLTVYRHTFTRHPWC